MVGRTALTISESILNLEGRTDRADDQRIHTQPGNKKTSREMADANASNHNLMKAHIHTSLYVCNTNAKQLRAEQIKEICQVNCHPISVQNYNRHTPTRLQTRMVGRTALTINEFILNLESRKIARIYKHLNTFNPVQEGNKTNILNETESQ